MDEKHFSRVFDSRPSFLDDEVLGDSWKEEISLRDMGLTVQKGFKWNLVKLPVKSSVEKVLHERVNKRISPDCVVVVAESRYDCHLILLQCYSEFFDKQTVVNPIELPADLVTPTAFEFIYKWMKDDRPDCYTIIRADIILSLLIASQFLQIKELETQLWEIIGNEKLFWEGAAFALYMMARHLEVPQVRQAMVPRIRHFFLTLVASADFLQLQEDDVCAFLASDNISVHNEIEVFMSAIRWLRHDWPSRKSAVAQVLSHVRFGLIPSHFLVAIRQETSEFYYIYGDNSRVIQMVDDGTAYAITKQWQPLEGEEFIASVQQQQLYKPPSRLWSQQDADSKLSQYEDFLRMLSAIQLTAEREFAGEPKTNSPAENTRLDAKPFAEKDLVELGFKLTKDLNWMEAANMTPKTNLYDLIKSRLRGFVNTDVEVFAGDHTFQCHMILLQCYSQLCHSHTEKKSIRLPTERVSRVGFSLTYKWMLSDVDKAHMCFQRGNILDIYAAAQCLQVKELIELCKCIIISPKLFSEESSYMLYLLAKELRMRDVQSLMAPRLGKFFLTLVSSHDFVSMDVEDVCAFLSADAICVNCEIEVFMAAVRWLTYDWQNRHKMAPQVMACIRFGLIPPWQLVNIRRSSPEFSEVTAHPEIDKMISTGLLSAVARCQNGDDAAKIAARSSATPGQRNSYDLKKDYLTYEDFLRELAILRRNFMDDCQSRKTSQMSFTRKVQSDESVVSVVLRPPLPRQHEDDKKDTYREKNRTKEVHSQRKTRTQTTELLYISPNGLRSDSPGGPSHRSQKSPENPRRGEGLITPGYGATPRGGQMSSRRKSRWESSTYTLADSGRVSKSSVRQGYKDSARSKRFEERNLREEQRLKDVTPKGSSSNRYRLEKEKFTGDQSSEDLATPRVNPTAKHQSYKKKNFRGDEGHDMSDHPPSNRHRRETENFVYDQRPRDLTTPKDHHSRAQKQGYQNNDMVSPRTRSPSNGRQLQRENNYVKDQRQTDLTTPRDNHNRAENQGYQNNAMGSPRTRSPSNARRLQRGNYVNDQRQTDVRSGYHSRHEQQNVSRYQRPKDLVSPRGKSSSGHRRHRERSYRRHSSDEKSSSPEVNRRVVRQGPKYDEDEELFSDDEEPMDLSTSPDDRNPYSKNTPVQPAASRKQKQVLDPKSVKNFYDSDRKSLDRQTFEQEGKGSPEKKSVTKEKAQRKIARTEKVDLSEKFSSHDGRGEDYEPEESNIPPLAPEKESKHDDERTTGRQQHSAMEEKYASTSKSEESSLDQASGDLSRSDGEILKRLLEDCRLTESRHTGENAGDYPPDNTEVDTNKLVDEEMGSGRPNRPMKTKVLYPPSNDADCGSIYQRMFQDSGDFTKMAKEAQNLYAAQIPQIPSMYGDGLFATDYTKMSFPGFSKYALDRPANRKKNIPNAEKSVDRFVRRLPSGDFWPRDHHEKERDFKKSTPAKVRSSEFKTQPALLEGYKSLTDDKSDTVLVFGGSEVSLRSTGTTIQRFVKGGSQWETIGKMPEARIYHGVCICRGKIYVVGGREPLRSDPEAAATRTVWSLDVKTAMWTRERDLAVPRSHPGVVAVNGHVWVIGGRDAMGALESVEIYDPQSRVWKEGPGLTVARYAMGVCVHERAIWVAGGKAFDSTAVLQSVERLFFNNDNKHMEMWVEARRLRFGRAYCTLLSTGEALYLVGGIMQDRKGRRSVADVDVFADEEWKLRTSLPVAKHSHAIARMGSIVLVIGGASNTNESNTVEGFDTANHVAVKVPSTGRPLLGHAAVTVPRTSRPR